MAAGGDRSQRSAGWVPYGLLSPGVLWLALFFLLPLAFLLRMSLSTRENRYTGETTFDWNWDNYTGVFSDYGEQFLRAFGYAGAATVLCILIGYPMAYFIARYGGAWRNKLLGLVILPFFTSFLIRTLAWQNILADEGPVVSFLRATPFFADDYQLLNTPAAVIGGLTYNFLPFMILPIYVSLEKIDLRLLDAAGDLYATPSGGFRRVVLPLSLPGVFAGTLLTFIPASGDFVNAALLGNPNTTMIGTVVQDQFLVQLNYPVAAALAFVLMLIITVAVLIYARFLGTEGLTV
ncbi:MAG: ABC transporter permease [Acidimicrobiales bacterium]|nr:ABC transporter permease [Acidimicrobiales bacterium]